MNLIKKMLFIKEKKPEVPVTQTELDQLKLQAQKAELQARIRKANTRYLEHKTSLRDSMKKVLGESAYNPLDVSTGKSDFNPLR